MDSNNEEMILTNKDGLLFKKIKKRNYSLSFSMENNHIILPKIIDFSLVKLIYDLNPDVYEKVNMEKLGDNTAVVTLLMKHFFEDMGLPQRYTFMHIQKIEEENRIRFVSQSILTHRPEGIPDEAEIMAVKQMNNVCEIISNHKIMFNFNIMFEDYVVIPPFAEKMISIILNKIFKRVKQFIENIRL